MTDPQDMTVMEIHGELIDLLHEGDINSDRYSALVDELAERSHE